MSAPRVGSSLLKLLPGLLHAEQMPLDAKGRFEGLAIVLRFARGQKREMAETGKLRLTIEQRVAISSLQGYSPSKLRMYDTRCGENDTVALAFNRGLRFSEDEFEVPRMYLVTDARAAELERELEG